MLCLLLLHRGLQSSGWLQSQHMSDSCHNKLTSSGFSAQVIVIWCCRGEAALHLAGAQRSHILHPFRCSDPRVCCAYCSLWLAACFIVLLAGHRVISWG
jgi:hypothetical protein